MARLSSTKPPPPIEKPSGPRCPLCGQDSHFHVYTAWGSLGRQGYRDCWTCYDCYGRLAGVQAEGVQARRVESLCRWLIAASALLAVAIGMRFPRNPYWVIPVAAVVSGTLLLIAARRKAGRLEQAAQDGWARLGVAGLSFPVKSP